MQGHYFCHILHATEGTAGINTIPAEAPGHRERWNKADLGGGKGGRERDEVRQEPRWSRHGWEPRPGCLCRPRRPARQAANGAPTSGTRPASAPGPARPADRRAHRHTSTHRHTQTHRRTRTKHTHSHLLDVLPDGGAVVADDEQLQGVIDEAVLQGRRRPWHSQAPGGSGAPSPAPQRPTPPFPSPRREATPPKHHLSPLETKGRGPASRFPSGFSPFPPTAGPAPGRADAPRPRAVRAARGAHHGAGGAAAAASRGWARLPHHLPRPPPPRVASAGSQWRARPLPQGPMAGAAAALSSNQRRRRGFERPRAARGLRAGAARG